jgi:hypothetical protein
MRKGGFAPTNFGQELDFVSFGLLILSHKGRGKVAAPYPLPLRERIGSPREPKAIGWTNLARGSTP